MFAGSNKNNYILLGVIVSAFLLTYYDLFLCRKTFSHDTIVWYGTFHYYIDCLKNGNFPYWDPYLTTGTYFYPNIPLHGLLEPLVMIEVLIAKIFYVSPLTLYVYLRLFRLLIFVIGAFYFFRHITKCRISALLSAGVLLFALPHSYFPQFGTVDTIYLTPFALYSSLLFLENHKGPKRYLYLSCIAFVTGISMIIYIPALYFFNLLVFVFFVFVLRLGNFADTARNLFDRRFLAFSILTIVLIGMMSAPPFMTMYKDASGNGELFPMQRIIQKNDRIFKKILASDVDTGNLSEKFTNKRAIFNSTGNLIGLLYPEMANSLKYWLDRDLISYIHQYIGIIPLVFCIIGFIYFKSRYKFLILIMLVIMFINGFSFYGVHDKPFNFLQDIFNAIFPPLKMYQGRENFGYFFLLYLCAFLSMGLSIFFREDSLRDKCSQIIITCLIFITVKIAISGYFAGKFLFTSAYDLFVMLQLVFFATWIFLYARRKITQKIFYAAVIFIVIADLVVYNKVYEKDVLQDSSSFYQALPAVKNSEETFGFQYFREPVVLMPLRHQIAFEESIWKIKGSTSLGFNHSLFTTKRYYDFLVHVPLQNQFILSGVVYPVIQFFPMDKVMQVSDKKELLNFYSTASTDTVADYLFIENPDIFHKKPVELTDFNQYEDVHWLTPENIFDSFSGFLSQNEDNIRNIRKNLNLYLKSSLYSIGVKDFSTNEVALEVSNSIDGYLYYNDGWSRYWQAFDNGREIPVKIANYNFKAVYLEKGDHVIRFVFNPVHYKIGLVAYYVGLLCSVGLIAVFYIKSRRKAFLPE